jgi:transcriptional regulator of met regulon
MIKWLIVLIGAVAAVATPYEIVVELSNVNRAANTVILCETVLAQFTEQENPSTYCADADNIEEKVVGKLLQVVMLKNTIMVPGKLLVTNVTTLNEALTDATFFSVDNEGEVVVLSDRRKTAQHVAITMGVSVAVYVFTAFFIFRAIG